MADIDAARIDLGQGLPGFYAAPSGGGGKRGLVLFIEAFGVNAHFERLAWRLAEAGFAVVVPDLFRGKAFAYDDIPGAIGALKGLSDAQATADTGLALDALTARGVTGRAGVMGFCMGGRLAFLANGAHATRVGAAACFYGGGIAPAAGDIAGRPPLLDRVPAMQGPLLLLYGSEDKMILPGEHAAIAEALTAARKRYTLTVFPHADHGFFCEDRPSYEAGAATESWDLTLAFLRRALG